MFRYSLLYINHFDEIDIHTLYESYHTVDRTGPVPETVRQQKISPVIRVSHVVGVCHTVC